MNSSIYMSDFFKEEVWPIVCLTLKRVKTQKSYFSYACSICDFCKCDFLDIKPEDAQRYFNHKRKENTLSNSSLHTILTAYISIGRCISSKSNNLQIDNYVSPFENIILTPRAMGLLSSDIVSASDLDCILNIAASDPFVYLAITLSFRCALTASEICSLYADSITPYPNGTGIAIVCRKANHTSRAVKLPKDVMDILKSMVNDFEEHSPIFINAHGGPMSLRVLQNKVHAVMLQAKTTRVYSLQDLRNSSIAYMLHAGADRKEVASYVNLDSKWMYRYTDDIVPVEAPCDYNYIQILPYKHS